MNPKKIYLSRFRRAIPFAFPNKRGLTRQVNQMLDDYLEFVPDATLDQMMADLGKPEDTAQSYLQDNEQDKVRNISELRQLLLLFLSLLLVRSLLMCITTGLPSLSKNQPLKLQKPQIT